MAVNVVIPLLIPLEENLHNTTRLLPGAGGPIQFSEPRYCALLPEDAPPAVTVAKVTAVHKEGVRVRYRITGGNRDGLFTINRRSGLITLAAPLDFELHPKHELVVAAEAGGKIVHTIVQVTVADVNDNPPQFLESDLTVSVVEEDDTGLPAAILKIAAHDDDIVDQGRLVYSVGGDGVDGYGARDAYFTINPHTGELIQLRALDRDPPRGREIWRVKVQVADGQLARSSSPSSRTSYPSSRRRYPRVPQFPQLPPVKSSVGHEIPTPFFTERKEDVINHQSEEPSVAQISNHQNRRPSKRRQKLKNVYNNSQVDESGRIKELPPQNRPIMIEGKLANVTSSQTDHNLPFRDTSFNDRSTSIDSLEEGMLISQETNTSDEESERRLSSPSILNKNILLNSNSNSSPKKHSGKNNLAMKNHFQNTTILTKKDLFSSLQQSSQYVTEDGEGDPRRRKSRKGRTPVNGIASLNTSLEVSSTPSSSLIEENNELLTQEHPQSVAIDTVKIAPKRIVKRLVSSDGSGCQDFGDHLFEGNDINSFQYPDGSESVQGYGTYGIDHHEGDEGRVRGRSEVHVAETVVTVIVKDINDNAPSFPNATIFGEVQENGPIGYGLGYMTLYC